MVPRSSLGLPWSGCSPAFCVDCDGGKSVVARAGAASHRMRHVKLLPMPGCRVERITPDASDLLNIAAHGMRPGGHCPDCGRASQAVHSRYRCEPADLPSLGRKVGVSLRVRRSYCLGRLPVPFAGDEPPVPARRDRASHAAPLSEPPAPAPGGKGAARDCARNGPGARDSAQICARRDLPGTQPTRPRPRHPRSLPVLTWSGAWRRVVKTDLPCGTNCAGKASLALLGRSTDG